MRIVNESDHPTDEVKRLVQYAMKGVRTERLYVRVKNTFSGVAGRAYYDTPFISPTRRMRTVDSLITLRVGPARTFPCDNMWMTRRWVDVSQDELDSLSDSERSALRYWSYSDGRQRAQREVIDHHPYGGKRSPHIVYADWQEGLVALAAHEARHLFQGQHEKPKSEVDAERWAAKRLEAYRRESGNA